MNTTLVLTFPLGRYHATPWGRHVNEGVVEFPPSPWRILRALYATWQQRVPTLDEGTVHRLLADLATPPTYFVPPHQVAHTRHYYPDSRSRTGKPSVDRTLDAFAVVNAEDELAVRWDVALDIDEREALGHLAKALPYLGRADSICEARLAENWTPRPQHSVWTLAENRDSGDGTGSVPDPTSVDTSARSSIGRLLAPALPLDLDSLVLTPLQVRSLKLLFPPAARQITFRITPGATPPRSRRRARPPVTAVRVALVDTVRPPFTEVVTVTDLLHQAVTRRLNTIRGDATRDSNLLGKTADGTPLEGHQHAHYLGLPDNSHRLSKILLWVPAGLDDDELAALAAVERLSSSDPAWKFGRSHVRINAYGGTDILPEWRTPATVWCSVTPYAPTGHPKHGVTDHVQRRLRRDLEYADPSGHLAGSLSEVTVKPNPYGPFQRRRSRARLTRQTTPVATFVQLRFTEPVANPNGGPLTLGALSHFGLGLFLPQPVDTPAHRPR